MLEKYLFQGGPFDSKLAKLRLSSEETMRFTCKGSTGKYRKGGKIRLHNGPKVTVLIWYW